MQRGSAEAGVLESSWSGLWLSDKCSSETYSVLGRDILSRHLSLRWQPAQAFISKQLICSDLSYVCHRYDLVIIHGVLGQNHSMLRQSIVLWEPCSLGDRLNVTDLHFPAKESQLTGPTQSGTCPEARGPSHRQSQHSECLAKPSVYPFSPWWWTRCVVQFLLMGFSDLLFGGGGGGAGGMW